MSRSTSPKPILGKTKAASSPRGANLDPPQTVGMTTKVCLVCLVVLIGLETVFDAFQNSAHSSLATKSSKSITHDIIDINDGTDDTFQLQALRGSNQKKLAHDGGSRSSDSHQSGDDHHVSTHSLTVHDDESQSSDSHQSSYDRQQEVSTHSLTVHDDESQSIDSNEKAVQEDVSSQESSLEEESDDEGRENTISQSNAASSDEDIESSISHHEIWEILWSFQTPSDPTENPIATDEEAEDDDEGSMDEKEDLWERLSTESTFSHSQFQDLFSAFPRPKRQNSIALYKEDALNELVSDLVQSHENGRNFTIVASGGSTTCGAAKDKPVTRQEERYYSLFAGYLNTLLAGGKEKDAQQTVQWIGQGHGARTSLHTTIFFDNFIPQDADLLLWEFSINDAIDWFEDDELFRINLRNNLLVWLQEVGRMKRPAKVMLVYYWNTPYHHDPATNEIVGEAFEAHATIAREFDFVVGHVNVGSFIDEVAFPGCSVWETCPLLVDKHHASKLGHVATAYLLLNLMNPSKEFLLPATKQEDAVRETSYEWSCGIETEAKQILKQAVVDPEKGWKPSLGGWTLDLPSYDQTTPRRLVAGPGMGEIEIVDKADPLRQDRKRCTALKYCGEDIPFSVIAPLESMENVHAVLLVFKKHEKVLYSEDINLFLNGSDKRTSGQLVPMRTEKDESFLRNWPCHFSGGWSSFADTYWYFFEDSQDMVDSMELCISSKMRSPPKIQSVAFW